MNNANLSMYADDHQMYVMGKKRSRSRAKYQDPRGASSIRVQEQLSLSQPRKVSAGTAYLQLTREMLTQTMLNKIFP